MVISFANLKGGVGKSKMNTLFANYLASKQLNVLIIDADVSQHTTQVYDTSSSLEEYLHTVAYVFEDGDLVDFIESNKAAYDYVLLDIPGTIQQQGVISALAAVDKVIVPTTFADDDIASTLKFIDLLIDLGMPYRVLMNKYEIQFDSSIRDAEQNNFKPLEELFGENVVFSKGIRFERSALQSNFVLGFYDLSHSKMKRIDEVMELIFEYVND